VFWRKKRFPTQIKIINKITLLCKPIEKHLSKPESNSISLDFTPPGGLNSSIAKVIPIDIKSLYEKLAKWNIAKMEKELRAVETPPFPTPQYSPKPLWIPPAIYKPPTVEICTISGTILNTIYKKYSDYKLFIVTL
jgi:hypothetical protein